MDATHRFPPFATPARLLAAWAILACALIGPSRADEVAGNDDAPRRIVLRLTEAAFVPLVAKEIDRTTPVAEVVLGTYVTGQARTTGKSSIELLDDQHQAAFVISIQGTTVSRTVGQSGPAIIQTRADTQFTATKRVAFVPGQGFVAEPAKITAHTRATNEGISTMRRRWISRLVVRVATRRVAAARSQVEAIGCQRAEARIAAAFDEVLETRLAKFNQAAEVRPALAMLLGTAGEPHYACCTRAGCIQIAASSEKFAAPCQLPALEQEPAPVQVWVHRTIFAQLPNVQNLLGGTGPAADAVQAAFEVVPPMLKQFNLPGTTDPMKLPVNYAQAGDWFVLQFEPQSLEPQPPGPRMPAAAARLWTSVDGRFTCQAGFVSATPESVTLQRTADGKLVTVPLSRLSAADQQAVRKL